jgi:hypothetical protein
VRIEFSARVSVDSEDPGMGSSESDLPGELDIEVVFARPLGTLGSLPPIVSLSPAMCGVGWP